VSGPTPANSLACAHPARSCACRQTARYAPAGAAICRRKGGRPDRVVDCEAPPSVHWCATCPLWGGMLGCLAGTRLAEEEDRRVHRPQRLGRIPLRGMT
jgi:hypothetical protein